MAEELDLQGASVLVTGGRGFLGRHVCRALAARGATPVAIGQRDYDLTEQGRVRALFDTHRPKVVVHAAAACGGIGANVANPGKFLHDNALMGLLVLEESRLRSVERFVLVSTTCAYPEGAPIPLSEEHLWDGPPTGATGPYGMAKRMLHEACRTYERQYGLRSAVVVPANLYGPEDHFDEASSHVLAAMVRRIVTAADAGDTRVVNWGTGRPTREFLHVADAAEAIVRAAERAPDARPINLGTGVETSIADLARLVADAAGFRGAIEWDTSKPDGQPRRSLDVTRQREWLGFVPSFDLTKGIRETVAWFRAHRAEIAP